MLNAVILIISIIFSPIVIELYSFYDSGSGRVNFGLYLFGKLKIFGGYAEIKNAELSIHYKNDKAIVFKLQDLFNMKGNAKSFLKIEFFKLKSKFYFPNGNKTPLTAASVGVFTSIFMSLYKTNKDFALLSNKIIVTDKENDLKIALNAACAFNLFVIILILIDIVRKKCEKKKTELKKS